MALAQTAAASLDVLIVGRIELWEGTRCLASVDGIDAAVAATRLLCEEGTLLELKVGLGPIATHVNLECSCGHRIDQHNQRHGTTACSDPDCDCLEYVLQWPECSGDPKSCPENEGTGCGCCRA